ncbi:unnamed protein product [Sphagnum balticum]
MHHHDADSIRAWLMRLEFPHLESCFLGLIAAEDFDISEDPTERTTICSGDQVHQDPLLSALFSYWSMAINLLKVCNVLCYRFARSVMRSSLPEKRSLTEEEEEEEEETLVEEQEKEASANNPNERAAAELLQSSEEEEERDNKRSKHAGGLQKSNDEVKSKSLALAACLLLQSSSSRAAGILFDSRRNAEKKKSSEKSVALGEEEWALAGLLHTRAAGSGVFFFFPLLHFPSTSSSQVFLEVFNQLKMLQMR